MVTAFSEKPVWMMRATCCEEKHQWPRESALLFPGEVCLNLYIIGKEAHEAACRANLRLRSCPY